MLHCRQEIQVNIESLNCSWEASSAPEDIGSDNTMSHEKFKEAGIAYGGPGQVTVI